MNASENDISEIARALKISDDEVTLILSSAKVICEPYNVKIWDLSPALAIDKYGEFEIADGLALVIDIPDNINKLRVEEVIQTLKTINKVISVQLLIHDEWEPPGDMRRLFDSINHYKSGFTPLVSIVYDSLNI